MLDRLLPGLHLYARPDGRRCAAVDGGAGVLFIVRTSPAI
jgi:hypothetical protein